MLRAMKRWVSSTYRLLDPHRSDTEGWLHPNPPPPRRKTGRESGSIRYRSRWKDQQSAHFLSVNFGMVALMVESLNQRIKIEDSSAKAGISVIFATTGHAATGDKSHSNTGALACSVMHALSIGVTAYIVRRIRRTSSVASQLRPILITKGNFPKIHFRISLSGMGANVD